MKIAKKEWRDGLSYMVVKSGLEIVVETSEQGDGIEGSSWV